MFRINQTCESYSLNNPIGFLIIPKRENSYITGNVDTK